MRRHYFAGKRLLYHAEVIIHKLRAFAFILIRHFMDHLDFRIALLLLPVMMKGKKW